MKDERMAGASKGNVLEKLRRAADSMFIRIYYSGMREDEGIDGILVTVGLCIIALLLCVVMKDSLTKFIQTIVTSMTKEAKDILTGTRV